MKVVFCSSEVMPYAKTGGLADVCGALPVILKQEDVDISIVMPFYACIDQKIFNIKKLTQDVFFTSLEGVDVYFIKNDEFFGRENLYGDAKGDYPDNLERFSFYSKRVLKLLQEIQLQPDIIHCHDWQSALIPVFLKSNYRADSFYKNTKTVLTIHNLAYQGVFKREQFFSLGLPPELNRPDGIEYYDKINFLKAGIIFSDLITTVSPTYSQEIRTKELGCGLEGVLRSRKDSVIGILNGIDVKNWNPKEDELIAAKYWPDKMQGKAENKKFLQEHAGLAVRADVPVFGFVGRLSYQKGIDLIAQSIDLLDELDVQLIFQGVGEEKYQKILEDIQKKYPKKVAVRFDFNEKFAHQIYAGSDFFMVPSVYEPCGLSQMISFRYGTVPLVYKTGGLSDTVMPFDLKRHQGDGFVFSSYQSEAFLKAFKKAIKAYEEPEVFSQLIFHIMHYDFSWVTSAKEYKNLYKRCLS